MSKRIHVKFKTKKGIEVSFMAKNTVRSKPRKRIKKKVSRIKKTRSRIKRSKPTRKSYKRKIVNGQVTVNYVCVQCGAERTKKLKKTTDKMIQCIKTRCPGLMRVRRAFK